MQKDAREKVWKFNTESKFRTTTQIAIFTGAGTAPKFGQKVTRNQGRTHTAPSYKS